MKVLLSFIVLAVSVLGTRGSGTIKCTVSASPVMEGQSVSITCHYNNKDLRKMLLVYRHDPSDANQHQVLHCTWNYSTDSRECEIKKPGYEQQNVSSEVKLVIPSVSKAHEGNYSCQVLGEKPDSSQPCTLRVNVAGFNTTCKAPPVTKGEPGEITCFFKKNLTEAKANVSVTRQPFVANGNVTVVFDCFWSNSKQNCTPRNGYKIEVWKNSMLTLRIENSSEEQEGRYTCKVAYSPHGNETPCDFRFKVKSTPSESNGSLTNEKTIGIIVGVVLFIILAVVGVVIFIYVRKRGQAIRNQPKSTPEEMPMCD